jgi:inner membrane protein
MQTSAFGVDLIDPVDDYLKSMRSVKYAIMTLALTFLVFFLVEILNGRRIHPFPYILVGLALCLFYILLISLSEQMDFNPAYLISSFTVILMITLYSISIFRSAKLTFLLFLILCAVYGFLFVTLQISDYPLLIGSIGVTVALALAMFFTRKVDWYYVKK